MSAWRRSSSATIGGWVLIELTTVTRTPFFCTASTKRRKSPSPENSTMWSTRSPISITSTVSSTSMSPFTLRRPMASVNSLVGLVTSV